MDPLHYLPKALRRSLGRVKFGFDVARARERAQRDFTTRSDDTFVVSYPRSGNTWTRFLIGNLLSATEVTFANVERFVPDLHVNAEVTLATVPSPRVLKSHAPYEPRFRRVIFIVRDPRDVAVSYHQHLRKMRIISDQTSASDFADRFISGALDRYGSWGEHTGSWLGARQGDDSFVTLKYEDMIVNPTASARKLAAFLGVGADDAALARAVARSSAERMKQLEDQSGKQWSAIRGSRADMRFVRSAKSGGWREELSPAVAERIVQQWRRHLVELGYEA